jgi:acetyl-CoA acetyltransferase
MREVGIVAFAQSELTTGERAGLTSKTSVELLLPVITDALAGAGLERRDVDFWCHGSCDYLTGQPFSFVAAVDAIGAWPPIVESHVEADGAFALYEAWVKIQTGEADTAVVFGNGRSSSGDTDQILTLQLDPYYVAPLWPDARSVAALQASAMLAKGVITERDMAEVAARSRLDALDNPYALVSGKVDVDELLSRPYRAQPLRDHDLPPVTDAAAAVVLAAGDAARRLSSRPAWIRGIDHRIDVQDLGRRDLTDVPSARLAAQKAGAAGRFDVAELHAPYSHQELALRRALGLDLDRVNPSGGALCANPIMATGLVRFGEVARRITAGEADRGLAHASSGPCLQQNLVAVMEGDS